jgi:hypothetical protein
MEKKGEGNYTPQKQNKTKQWEMKKMDTKFLTTTKQ